MRLIEEAKDLSIYGKVEVGVGKVELVLLHKWMKAGMLVLSKEEMLLSLKQFVADIASLSRGNEESTNPEKLFDDLIRWGHNKLLEFIRFDGGTILDSLRHELEEDFIIGNKHANMEEVVKEVNNRLRNLVDGYWRMKSTFVKGQYLFRITAPIFVFRQLMTHRQSWLEMSRRYVDEKKQPVKCHIPDMGNEKATKEMDFAYTTALNCYQHLLSMGVKAEQARACLPMGMFTTAWVLFDEAGLDNFFTVRCDEHAQAETREIANAMKNLAIRVGGLDE